MVTSEDIIRDNSKDQLVNMLVSDAQTELSNKTRQLTLIPPEKPLKKKVKKIKVKQTKLTERIQLKTSKNLRHLFQLSRELVNLKSTQQVCPKAANADGLEAVGPSPCDLRTKQNNLNL